MNYRHFKYEGWLYGLAFLLALGIRLPRLGDMPLNDDEATLALQALQLSQGLKPALGPHPAYLMFTTVLFFLHGGGTNFLARLAPALVGCLLVFVPLLFASRLKPRPALILAFFIAFEPGLVAISRQAAGPIFAITFLLGALGFLVQGKPRQAGLFAGLALLGGPSLWPGLLGLAIGWAILQPVAQRLTSNNQGIKVKPIHVDWKEILVAGLLTFVVAGSLFFLVPNGLSAALASLQTYWNGWVTPSNMQAVWLLISLPAYQSFAILLAVITIVRGWRNGSLRVVPLSIWLLVSLLLAIFYPGRHVADLAWALIPLWALAALGLVRFIDVQPQERNEALGAIGLVAFLWVFGWFNFTAWVWAIPGQPAYTIHLSLVFGAIALLVVSLVLVAYGWSIRVAQVGAVWGLALGMGVLGLGGTLGATGVHGMMRPELWWPMAVPQQAGLLDKTVDDLSEWGMGYDNAVRVIIYRLRSPALEWALREHGAVTVDVLDVASVPELVITDFAGDPALAASYRGQDFTWRQTTSWETAQARDWLRWLAYREMPQNGEIIILWAREDLFLGSSLAPAQ
jgi:hypothetical protein